jgi:surface polysaccharide O-acyltransferase-like enzyme
MRGGGPSPVGLRILADLSFVLACFANCFCVLAIFLRFATTRLPASAELKNNAYGMYLVHYLFVVWLQFALLAAALPAVLKGVVVFAATLLLSWGTVAVLGRLPSVAQVIGTGGPRGVAAS